MYQRLFKATCDTGVMTNEAEMIVKPSYTTSSSRRQSNNLYPTLSSQTAYADNEDEGAEYYTPGKVEPHYEQEIRMINGKAFTVDSPATKERRRKERRESQIFR